ncbi:MAG: DUF2269 domain-containing protein [Hyphomicrobiales bacterium]|nr:DUF2269 domain-containing protein [Hyphomicrobiales bacterium]MCP5373125.1 DUF2269 domain-containing protein [Hyphomicrobiales bacterium]
MDAYLTLRVLHILGAMVLFGTGMGTAFAMWAAHLRGDVRAIAVVARNVVLADWLFTAPAVVVQPVTGALLMAQRGIAWDEPWVLAALALYVLTGACWLPVVWLQIRVRDLAVAAAETGAPLPPLYHRHMRAWFILGWPAFAAVLGILVLMVARPDLG